MGHHGEKMTLYSLNFDITIRRDEFVIGSLRWLIEVIILEKTNKSYGRGEFVIGFMIGSLRSLRLKSKQK